MSQNYQESNSFITQLLEKLGINKEKLRPYMYAFIGLAVIAIGFYYYKYNIKEPKIISANNALFQAEKYLRIDSFQLALNGSGAVKGFLNIIKNYSGTPAENISHYYAGICYIHLENFKKAIEQLEKYDGDDPIINMMCYGSMADAYSELKNNTKAIDYYIKAAETAPEQENIASEYLFRAASLSEVTGNLNKSLDLYKKLKREFPKSEKAIQIDKYIARLDKN